MSKEFKVGLLALVSGALLYYGFNFLKGVDFFSNTNKYFAVYDNIDGLQVSNPVIVNGFSVGRVSRIMIMQDQNNKVLVELDVDDQVAIGDSTKALLYNVDFLGSKGIQLDIKQHQRLLVDGDTLISDQEGGISDIAETQINNLSVTISRINDILLGMQGSGEEIKETIIAFKGTLNRVNASIDQNRDKISETVNSFLDLSKDLKGLNEKLSLVLDNTNNSLEKVNQLKIQETLTAYKELAETMNSTLLQLKEGEGTLGKLMTNDSLYNNMNKMVVDLDSLLNHMNQYPKHFFAPLGKKNKKIVKEMSKG